MLPFLLLPAALSALWSCLKEFLLSPRRVDMTEEEEEKNRGAKAAAVEKDEEDNKVVKKDEKKENGEATVGPAPPEAKTLPTSAGLPKRQQSAPVISSAESGDQVAKETSSSSSRSKEKRSNGSAVSNGGSSIRCVCLRRTPVAQLGFSSHHLLYRYSRIFKKTSQDGNLVKKKAH